MPAKYEAIWDEENQKWLCELKHENKKDKLDKIEDIPKGPRKSGLKRMMAE